MAYYDWKNYVLTLNNNQLGGVYRTEADRARRYGTGNETGDDSRDAVEACRVEAAKRGIPKEA